MSNLATQEPMEMAIVDNHMSPHATIQLLMAGALIRLDEAALHLRCGREDEAGRLMEKAIGIINGLRESLDFEQGGDMAVKFERLYCHLIDRLVQAEADTGEYILAETSRMLEDLKNGWDAIAK